VPKCRPDVIARFHDTVLPKFVVTDQLQGKTYAEGAYSMIDKPEVIGPDAFIEVKIAIPEMARISERYA